MLNPTAILNPTLGAGEGEEALSKKERCVAVEPIKRKAIKSQLIALEQAAFASDPKRLTPSYSYIREMSSSLYNAPDSVLIVLNNPGDILLDGFAFLTRRSDEPNTYYLNVIATRESGKHFATEIHKKMITELKARGATHLVADVDTGGLYEEMLRAKFKQVLPTPADLYTDTQMAPGRSAQTTLRMEI